MKLKQKGKILAAAMAMMTLSTAAAVTGTVAWFTASNVVSASGMSIQADTESGINISNESLATWGDSAIASHNGEIPATAPATGNVQAKFIPTSTDNGTKWYHANSNQRDNYEPSSTPTELTKKLNGTDTGVWCVNQSGSSIHEKNIYLVNEFYLRASVPSPIDADNFYVNSVTASVSGTAISEALNKSLRVLFKHDSSFLIFAPFETEAEVALEVHGMNPAAPIHGAAKDQVLCSTVQIPASTVTAKADLFKVEVYVYFEGGDTHCKSSNINASTLDTLALEFELGTETKY